MHSFAIMDLFREKNTNTSWVLVGMYLKIYNCFFSNISLNSKIHFIFLNLKFCIPKWWQMYNIMFTCENTAARRSIPGSMRCNPKTSIRRPTSKARGIPLPVYSCEYTPCFAAARMLKRLATPRQKGPITTKKTAKNCQKLAKNDKHFHEQRFSLPHDLYDF